MLNEAYKPVFERMEKTEIKKAKEKIAKMNCKYHQSKKELLLFFIDTILNKK